MRYFGNVCYFGKNYEGWQTQPNKNGVEDKIEDIFSSILDEKIDVVGAGRTDKGVHAYNQAFHFDTKKEIKDLDHFVYAVNRLLPDDIKIKKLVKTTDDFHARFSAKKKAYIYKIYTGDEIPFYSLTHWIVKNLETPLLITASSKFIGTHNFQNLTSKEMDPKGFVRTIYSIDVFENGNEIEIRLVGDGFMRYMVRDIIGEMVEVATKKKNLEDLSKLFSKTRKITNKKAPAEGLYLEKIFYED